MVPRRRGLRVRRYARMATTCITADAYVGERTTSRLRGDDRSIKNRLSVVALRIAMVLQTLHAGRRRGMMPLALHGYVGLRAGR